MSSVNDTHFLKRVQEFIDYGYDVDVYGFKRVGLPQPNVNFRINVLGEISCGNYYERFGLFRRTMKLLSQKESTGIFFYSSLDIAMFATKYIKSPYIYEICDLTELTISNIFIRRFLISQNKRIITNSLQTIITSEGFAEFYDSVERNKFSLIPNKVSTSCPPPLPKEENINLQRIKIGFVGVIRFDTIYKFIQLASCRDNIIIHLYGIYANGDPMSKKINELADKKNNIFYHGPFKNPDDLPSIYKDLDLVLSTYPPTPGVIYAEPNKLYEAMYFRTPIIVSKNTFLGRKVERLNIGYIVDATSNHAIEEFLDTFNYDDYLSKVNACHNIYPQDCLNINDDFFKHLKTKC